MMFDRLFSKIGKKRAPPVDEGWSDEEALNEDPGARSGRDNNERDNLQQASDGWEAPDMADVLGFPRRPAPQRGVQNTPPRSRQNKRTPSASTRHRRQPPARQPPIRPPPIRELPEQERVIEGRAANTPWEVENPFLRELNEIEAAHGPFDTVGSIQRGADMFWPAGPTPNTFMPHLAAHAEYPHHLALAYDMSHAHPSMYEGAPLIRGFPAHDRILETMQHNNAENYRGRNLEDGGLERRNERRGGRR